MTTPEDALVEAVARALCLCVWRTSERMQQLVDQHWKHHANDARAAIAAARPAIEAEAYRRAISLVYGHCGSDNVAERTAAAIRALIPDDVDAMPGPSSTSDGEG